MNPFFVFILICSAAVLTAAGTYALLVFAQAQKAVTAKAVADTAQAKATLEVELAARAAADAAKQRSEEYTKLIREAVKQMAAGNATFPGLTRDGMICLDPHCKVHGTTKTK